MNRVQRRGLDPLCIAVSGYPFPPEVHEPGVSGFHYHLQKPLDCKQVCSLLEKKATL